jgi:hypothetical protein
VASLLSVDEKATVKKARDKLLIVDDHPANIWTLTQNLQSRFDGLCVARSKNDEAKGITDIRLML